MSAVAPRAVRRARAIVLASLLACHGNHDALAPAGIQAARIGRLFWLFVTVCATVYAIVLLVLLVGLLRRRRHEAAASPEVDRPPHGTPARTLLEPEPARERRVLGVVGASTVVATLILIGLLAATMLTGGAIASLREEQPLAVQIIGHQWWWEVQYPDPDPSRSVMTANELHVPVGRPVTLYLTSRDVIHSLWIPALHGKRDLIPGHLAQETIRADRPGVFRGQCAEFCGPQHAHMGLHVVAEDAGRFEAWLAGQRHAAPPPASDKARRGQQVFLGGACVMCHRVLGTTASATSGPDLSHVASRQTLAAGTLPNGRGNLAGWIADPQGVKPGTKMPQTDLPPEDLDAVVEYLETLR